MTNIKLLLSRIGMAAAMLAGLGVVAAFAQDAAPAAADAAAAAATEAPKLDSGDTAWMLTSTALVLMMTVPGLALFYGGMVRKMNVLATLMQSFAITCLVTILWAVIGYSLAFTDGNPYVGDLSRLMLTDIGWDKPFILGTGDAAVTNTIPETVFMMFQMTFGIITPALICGSFADRMKFSAMLWFMGLWSILIYSPIAHWVWQPNGFLFGLGVLDFAGGTVVHINAGIAGLMTALVLGKRQGYGKIPMPPHNLVLTLIGASLLWVGWFGFNAGSATAANGRAGMAMTVTQIATAAAALAWMFTEWLVKGKPSVLGIASGAVAGLVAITPASGFVLPGGSIVIGVAAGVVCFFASTTVKNLLGYDDALDAFGVHCVGGIVGALLTGVFAAGVLTATDALPEGLPGLLEGNPGQVWIQCIGIACTLVYSGIGSFIILKVVDAIVGLRVSEEAEREGLDQALHGEQVH